MQIIINKTYFDNIKVAIDAMNNFFASGFKTKSFPVMNDNFQLDRILSRTLSWLDNVEPSWIEDPNKAVETLEMLKREVMQQQTQPQPPTVSEAVTDAPADPTNPWVKIISGENKHASDMFHAFIGFKVLQYISTNFSKYEALMNGIYSFELFTKPSMFRESIMTFTTPIPMPELDSIAKLPGEYKLFDASDYVNSVFDNPQIKLPESMEPDTEIQRFQSFGDLTDCQIVIDDSVQEAATIDTFSGISKNIKYSNGKWKVSGKFESAVNTLIKKLRECNTTDDLLNMFRNLKIKGDVFADTVVPAILVRTLIDPRKYPIDMRETFSDYTKAYTSIVKKNGGARRYERIDLFSTFKTDKDGTIQFLEDFFKLNLINNERAVISNNSLLTVFNIFDSHIYLALMYRTMGNTAETEDGFIKRIRSRINQNSRSANPYQKRREVKQSIEGSSQVVESVMDTIKELGDISIPDMLYCESFAGAVYDDIETIGDALYNKGVSSILIDRYIGESYDLISTIVQEAAENGEMPSYIQARLGLRDKSDEENKSTEAKKKQKKETSSNKEDDDDDDDIPIPDYMKNRMDSSDDVDPLITDIQLPPDIPTNKPDELANSIDARLDTNATSLGDMLGADYKGDIKPANHGGPGSVVYNITNNYSNSHNTTTHNDLSQKSNVSNVTTNDLSENKRTTSTQTNGKPVVKTATKSTPTNNYDNTRPSSNSKETSTFSNGKSVQEVFALLNSEEPLFVESVSGNPPKGDMLTAAMDVDRATLPAQQKLKRGVQYVKNTGSAIKKPIARTKDWLRTTVDSFIKRDEERVKADLVENPSYRSALYKVGRIALKTGKIALFSAISPWLGALAIGAEVLNLLDRDRLRKEAEQEIATEIKIVDEKIEHLKHGGRWGSTQSEEQRQELYKLMRMRQKLVDMSTAAHKQKLANPKSVY